MNITGFDLGVWIAIYFGFGFLKAILPFEKLNSANEPKKKLAVPGYRRLSESRSERGQTLVEYALILAFISVVAISVLIRLGDEVKLIFTTITSQLAIAGSSH